MIWVMADKKDKRIVFYLDEAILKTSPVASSTGRELFPNVSLSASRPSSHRRDELARLFD